MKEGLGGRHPAARSALDEAFLEQVRLVDVLERVLFLGYDDRQRAEPDRSPVELLADGAQDLAVEPIEPLVVDLEQVERRGGDGLVDRAGVADLGVVADALE